MLVHLHYKMIGWIYGSGFPKATDLSKQFDKQAGAERKVTGVAGKSGSKRNSMSGDFKGGEYSESESESELAKKWDGWKYGLQSLKPALEPIAVFQKPLE